MTRFLLYLRRLFSLVVLASVSTVMAEDRVARVAVASNFTAVMVALKQQFEMDGTHRIKISTASTGTLYAQILNGAPFDLLLAADALRPTLLEDAGRTVTGRRYTYAIGRLVVWSRDQTLQADDCEQALAASAHDAFNGRVAIANPDTAPYGAAARQALVGMGLWDGLQSRLVYGENISQTLHFVATGNARLGLVAAAQLQAEQLPATSCRWDIPADSYESIEQQAVLMQRGADNPAALAFFDFLRGSHAREIISAYDYSLPAVGKAR